MIHFPNKTFKRYTYTAEETGVYGETVPAYEYADDVQADFQHENNIEVARAYGLEKQNLYKAYIARDAIIDDTDVLVDDDGEQYTIIGEVQEYDHFHDYKRIHLAHARGDKLCQ